MGSPVYSPNENRLVSLLVWAEKTISKDEFGYFVPQYPSDLPILKELCASGFVAAGKRYSREASAEVMGYKTVRSCGHRNVKYGVPCSRMTGHAGPHCDHLDGHTGSMFWLADGVILMCPAQRTEELVVGGTTMALRVECQCPNYHAGDHQYPSPLVVIETAIAQAVARGELKVRENPASFKN